MNSFSSALKAAFDKTFGAGVLEGRLKKAEHDRMVELGRRLMLAATKATVEGRLKDALEAVKTNRRACATFIAAEASKELKRFVPIGKGFAELELMEQLWREKIAEQEAPPLSAAG